jgi:hypothetical protein
MRRQLAANSLGRRFNSMKRRDSRPPPFSGDVAERHNEHQALWRLLLDALEQRSCEAHKRRGGDGPSPKPNGNQSRMKTQH